MKCYAEVCVSCGALDKPIKSAGLTHPYGFSVWTVINTPGRGGDPDDSEAATLHESFSLPDVLAKAFYYIISNRIDNASEVTFGGEEESDLDMLEDLSRRACARAMR